MEPGSASSPIIIMPIIPWHMRREGPCAPPTPVQPFRQLHVTTATETVAAHRTPDMTEPDGLILVRCTLNVRTAAHRRTPSDRYRDLLRSDTRMEYDELRNRQRKGFGGDSERGPTHRFPQICETLTRGLCACPSIPVPPAQARNLPHHVRPNNVQRGTCNAEHAICNME